MIINKKIMVTGAGGYIGTVLCEQILSNNYSLNILDTNLNNNAGLKGIIENKNTTCFEGDIRDSEILKKAMEQVDTVIHLAAISDGNAGKANPELTNEINYNSLENILIIAKSSGVKRFLFASTFGVYGNKYNQLLTEDLKPKPVDPYSESKLKCENLLINYTNKDFITCSLRSAMVFGLSPNIRIEFLVNKLTEIALESGKITVQGGDQKRPQVHVSDLANVFVKLIEINPNKIKVPTYNVVCCNPSVLEIAMAVKNILTDTVINILEKRQKEDSFEMDGSKFFQDFGFIPKKSIVKGIKELINKLKKT